MNPIDEPVLGPDGPTPEPATDPDLPERIARLVQGEPFAVLCTQGDGQPYGSVIAIAVEPRICASWPSAPPAPRASTACSMRCRRVALVIDDRSKHGDDTRRIVGRDRHRPRDPSSNRGRFTRWQAALLRPPSLPRGISSPRRPARCSWSTSSATSTSCASRRSASGCPRRPRDPARGGRDRRRGPGRRQGGACWAGCGSRAGAYRGLLVTTAAYAQLPRRRRLESVIRMELGRKSLDDMRWEEIWDAALRLRCAFLAAEFRRDRCARQPAAVSRVSATTTSSSCAPRRPARTPATRSFAGLHESVVGVRGAAAVLDAVRIVWASLWSDAALLYRRELGLDPARSRMAVLVQQLVVDRSLGRGLRPRSPRAGPGRHGRRGGARPLPRPGGRRGGSRPLAAACGSRARWWSCGSASADAVAEPGPLLGADDLDALRRTVLSWRISSAGRPTWSGPGAARAVHGPAGAAHHPATARRRRGRRRPASLVSLAATRRRAAAPAAAGA